MSTVTTETKKVNMQRYLYMTKEIIELQLLKRNTFHEVMIQNQ